MKGLKILLEDLVETYYYSIGIDLLVIDNEQNIMAMNKNNKVSQLNHGDFIFNMVNSQESLDTSTVVNIDDIPDQNFIISPIMSGRSVYKYMLVAGPFAYQDTFDFSKVMSKVNVLSEVLMALINSYDKKKNIEERSKILSELMDSNLIDNSNLMIKLMDECHQRLYHMDFLGYAEKVDQHVFTVKHIVGSENSLLEGASFFVGEGLLGQCAALGKKMVWENLEVSTRIDFFKKHGMSPNHLYAFPLIDDGKCSGIWFGGTNRSVKMYEEDIELAEAYLTYAILSQKLIRMISKANDTSSYYHLLMDFLEVIAHSDNRESIIYKLLDIFISANVISTFGLTLKSDKFYSRGHFTDEMMDMHQKLLEGPINDDESHRELYTNVNGLIQRRLVTDNVFIGGITFTSGPEAIFDELIRVIDILVNISLDRLFICDHKVQLSKPRVTMEEDIRNQHDYQENVIQLDHHSYTGKTIDLEDIEKVKDVKSVIKQLPLTAREQEVLHLILEGLNNQEVAEDLTISIHTVKNHLTNIFRKLDVADRVQAMAKIYKIKYSS
ncbi:response regulator transcription factor [Litchfieldia salsa]|uniref:response regulator transcription factor n=1 Tax=Litchfieldia salsa TaxID=930152 RepID=UPI002368BEB0|nr:LuxR family transcriptional regulator [Litchfieldia salsa]